MVKHLCFLLLLALLAGCRSQQVAFEFPSCPAANFAAPVSQSPDATCFPAPLLSREAVPASNLPALRNTAPTGRLITGRLPWRALVPSVPGSRLAGKTTRGLSGRLVAKMGQRYAHHLRARPVASASQPVYSGPSDEAIAFFLVMLLFGIAGIITLLVGVASGATTTLAVGAFLLLLAVVFGFLSSKA